MSMRELRRAAGLTQEQVAKLVEVDQAAVSNWELGKNRPAQKYKKKLAKLYGVSEDALTVES